MFFLVDDTIKVEKLMKYLWVVRELSWTLQNKYCEEKSLREIKKKETRKDVVFYY